MRNLRNICSPIFPLISVFFLALSQGASDGFVASDMYSFLNGRDERVSIDLGDYLVPLLMFFIALPLALTMSHHCRKSSHQALTEADDEHHALIPQDPQHHSCRHKFVDFTTIALPFSFLSSAGINHFLSVMTNAPGWLRLPTSIILGIVNGLGNNALHSHHRHQRETWLEMLTRIPGLWNKSKALLIALAIFLGHGAQGFLAGNLLVISFVGENLDNIYLKVFLEYLIPVGTGLAVLASEGYTEFRTYLSMSKPGGFPEISGKSKMVLGIPSLAHASMSVMGLIQFIRFIYTQETGKKWAETLPLTDRITILSVCYFLVGLPNAIGFFSTTGPVTQKVLESIMPSIFSQRRAASFEDDLFQPELVEQHPQTSMEPVGRGRLCCISC